MATPVIQFARAADGVQIAFAAVGGGRSLVLCDGPFQPLRRGWSQGIAGRLAGWFHVVRLDHRGTGRSDRQAKPEGLVSQVRDLEAVVDEIGVGPFVLCGYSHGAHAAIAFTARHPERVTHLVIYGAPGPHQTPRSTQQQEYDAAFDRLLKQALTEDNLFARRAFAMAMIPSASLPDLDQYAEDFVEHITAEVMLAYNDASRASTIELVAPNVTVPTLVMHVAADPLEDFAGGQRLAALIPGARLLSLDGTDHLLRGNQAETETFVAELVDFVGAPPEAKPTSPASDLSPREREVIEFLARGDSNQEIAHALGLSVRTVERHLANLYRKIEARGRADAIAYALRHGLDKPRPRPLG